MASFNRNYERRHIHQAEAFREIRLSFDYTRKMQILFPTGGGKTNTQIDTIRYYLHNYCNHKTGVVVVLAPRIQLCIQHMEEHMNNPKYLGFHGKASSNKNNRVKFSPNGCSFW
jgi:superfamily II DNA or RNA helicase